MTTATLVDRGLAIRRELNALSDELKQIENALREAGLTASATGNVEPLKDAEREGRRWLAHGTQRTVPIIFTADKLIGSFTLNSKSHQVIEPVAAGHLDVFFKRTTTFENRFDSGKKFRATATRLFGHNAPPFITACLARDKAGLPRSDIKIEWDHAEPK